MAVQSVDPDTPAWQAGLRPGYGILSVQGADVREPQDFYRAVEDPQLATQPLELRIVRADGRPETIEVAP